MDDTINVVLVDDHPIFRWGLRRIIEDSGTPEIRLLAEASNAETALALVETYLPDVLISDLKLGATFQDGLNVISQTRRISPHTHVLVITAFDDSDVLLQALQVGAHGCLSKADQLDSEGIRRAIATVARGEAFWGSLVFKRIYELALQGFGRPHLINDPLTTREHDVLRLIADGKSNQEIANTLCISLKTVKTHVSNILAKLQLHSRYEAAIYYRTCKLP